MERVRVGLQVAIEDERASDPAAFDRLERDDAAFTSFAYDTHPEAYWQAGLGELPVGDLANIGLTPDVKDLLAWDGLVQVGDIALRLAMKWGEDGIDALAGEGTTDQMGEALLDGFEMIGAGIDDIAGPGPRTCSRARPSRPARISPGLRRELRRWFTASREKAPKPCWVSAMCSSGKARPWKPSMSCAKAPATGWTGSKTASKTCSSGYGRAESLDAVGRHRVCCTHGMFLFRRQAIARGR